MSLKNKEEKGNIETKPVEPITPKNAEPIVSEQDSKALKEIREQLAQEAAELDAITTLKNPDVDAKDEVIKLSRPVLVVNNLVKTYGTKKILKGISFTVNSGEIVGLLGENAAGKTTMFKCISHSTDCEGRILIDGVDHNNTPNLGLLWVESGMDPDISLRENLKFYCRLYDLTYDEFEIRKALREYNLEKELSKTWKYLSTGQKRKSAIARSFLKKSTLYLLDEPTSGLDFNAQNNFQRFLKEHAAKSDSGYIVITHNYADLESLCDKIIILDKGEILDFDTVENISKKYLQGVLVTLTIDNERANIDDIKLLLADSNLAYFINSTIDSRITTIYLKINDTNRNEYTRILNFIKSYVLRQKIERINLKTFVDLLLSGVVFRAKV